MALGTMQLMNQAPPHPLSVGPTEAPPPEGGSTTSEVLGALLANAPNAAAYIDQQGVVQAGNRRFEEVAGPTLAHPRIDSVFPTLGMARWGKLWLSLAEHGYLLSHEALAGSPTPQSLALSLQRVVLGDRCLALLQFHAATAEREAEGISLLQREVLESVASDQDLGIVMDLLCRRVEALAPELMCSVLRVDSAGLVHPCAAPSLPPVFSEAIDGMPIGPKAGSCGTAAWRGEPVEVRDIAHDPLWDDYRALALPLGLAACWSSPIKTRDGRVAGTFALYYREPRGAASFHRRMVEACVQLCGLAFEHDEAERQIRQLAFHDPLTGLANRTLLRDRAHQALSRSSRETRPLAVLLLDLDHFKTINDSLGHGTGDLMLRAISGRLRACLRAGDTLARIGGDEFVVLHDGGSEQARQLAARILGVVTDPVPIDGTNLTVSASIGISVAPDDAHDFETLLKRADAAMYHAKARGRNTYHFYRSTMNHEASDRLATETALRRALTDRALLLHYEPQIDLAEHRVRGVEALVRWQHPQRGLLRPGDFIPLAEEIGLIAAIDHWVLDQACAQFAQWRADGVPIETLSVNFSVAGFQLGDMSERVRLALQRHCLPPECLTLEITESFMLHSVEETVRALQELRSLGVGLAVDDFGTGYSSLSYLRRFPISTLKLDRSFLHDLDQDDNNSALAHAIIQLAGALNHTLIAEGVETESQRQFLLAHGCRHAQGYLFTQPLPADEMRDWLLQSASRLARIAGAAG